MIYNFGFCGVWNPDKKKINITELLELHKAVRATYEDPEYVDFNKQRRMLDMREHGFRMTDSGLKYTVPKMVLENKCEFIDKYDGEVYHLVVIQGVRYAPSLDGISHFTKPVKFTVSKSPSLIYL